MRLPASGPLDVAALCAILTAHAVPGLERLHGWTHERLWPTTTAGPVWLRLQLLPDGVLVEGDADAELLALVAQVLDLGHDPERVRHLAADPLLAGRFRHGLRVLGYPSAFEAVAATVVGQQVSLAGARTLTGRLVAGWGKRGPGGLLAFPDAARVAEVPAPMLREVIGLTRSRAETLAAVARLFADGFQPTLDDYRPDSPLGRLPGIGPWTLDYLRLRLGRDPDAFVPGDRVARRALGVQTPAQALALAERWRPWRGYALVQLWTAAAYLPRPGGGSV